MTSVIMTATTAASRSIITGEDTKVIMNMAPYSANNAIGGGVKTTRGVNTTSSCRSNSSVLRTSVGATKTKTMGTTRNKKPAATGILGVKGVARIRPTKDHEEEKKDDGIQQGKAVSFSSGSVTPPQPQRKINDLKVTILPKQEETEGRPSPPPPPPPPLPLSNKPPLMPAPLPLRRHQSEPTSQAGRRCIFGQYWNNQRSATAAAASASEIASSQLPISPHPNRLLRTQLATGNSDSDLDALPEHLQLPDVATPSAPTTPVRTATITPMQQPPAFPMMTTSPNKSIRDFPPPLDPSQAVFLRRRHHFKRVEELSPEQRHKSMTSFDTSLAPLPVPLRRFCSENDKSSTSSSGGVYPLCAPKPILRQSSYRDIPCSNSNGKNKGMGGGGECLSEVYNLTKSIRRFETPPSVDDILLRSTSSTSSSSHDSSSHGNGRARRTLREVSFDPRVTVTEFEEYNQRQWFADADLERFRIETVLVAQKYLANHPDMVQVYNQPRLDPVTGTLRKKALFSLPALSSVDDEDIRTELVQYGNLMQKSAYQQVKKILIVDRNKLILDLFRRSLSMLFPHAKITTVQTAEEAMTVFRGAAEAATGSNKKNDVSNRGFDIVIAEETLHQPLTHHRIPAMKSGHKSTQNLPELTVDAASEDDGEDDGDEDDDDGFVPVVRHESLTNLSQHAFMKQPQGISGSELLQKLGSLHKEDDKQGGAGSPNTTTKKATATTTPSSPMSPGTSSPSGRKKQYRMDLNQVLLIGVSAHPDQDSKTFYKRGADLVWGKPPPRMDDRLRDQLVSVLAKKRNAHASTSSAAAAQTQQKKQQQQRKRQ